MYGKTSKTAHYLPRTGSYSTVPHRNGRVDVLPPEARDAELTYLECKEQIDTLIAEQLKCEARAKDLRKQLEISQPKELFHRLSKAQQDVGKRLQSLQANMREVRQLGRAACDHAFAVVYFHVAKMRLSPELQKTIFGEAQSLLGHGWREGVGFSNQENRSDEAKARDHQLENARRRTRKAEAFIARVQTDPGFVPDGRRPMSVNVNEAHVADLVARRSAATLMSLEDQIEFARRQMNRLEQKRNEIVRNRGELWPDFKRDLIAARAVLNTLTAMTADRESSAPPPGELRGHGLR